MSKDVVNVVDTQLGELIIIQSEIMGDIEDVLTSMCISQGTRMQMELLGKRADPTDAANRMSGMYLTQEAEE